ncbi:MAG: hypothetical protein AAGF83_22395 [Cyanobacteria bacterium P01_G01_bin.67]
MESFVASAGEEVLVGNTTADFTESETEVFVDLNAGTATTVDDSAPGFITNQAPMVFGVNGIGVQPIFTIGETLVGTTGALNPSSAGDFTPTGITDGIGAITLDDSTVRLFVNSEINDDQGTPYKVNVGTEKEFELVGSRVHYFDVDIATKMIVDGGLAYNNVFGIDGEMITGLDGIPINRIGGEDQSLGFEDICSGGIVEAGTFNLEDTIYFFGEEEPEGINYALDAATGDLHALPFLGRGSFENIAAIDTGTEDKVAFLLGDDQFPLNTLYLYVGAKDTSEDVSFLGLNGLDGGDLMVWVPNVNLDDDPTNGLDSTEFGAAGDISEGTFVKQTSFDPSMAGEPGFDDFGFALSGTLRTEALDMGATFFSRVEDVSTNPIDGSEAVFGVTGSPFDGDLEVVTNDDGSTTVEGASNEEDPFDLVGSLIEADVDFTGESPTATLTTIYDGDTDPALGLRNPDNLDWADDGFVYVNEDEAFPFDFEDPDVVEANATEASIIKVDPNNFDEDGNALTEQVVEVNRDVVQPFGSFDAEAGDAGEWETSGTLDVSNLFGEEPGSLIAADLQADIEGGVIDELDLVNGGQIFFFGEPDVVNSPAVSTDTLEGITDIVATELDDVLIGDGEANSLEGLGGNDSLSGKGGADTLLGGNGDDILAPAGGLDVVDGGEGSDMVTFFDLPFELEASLETGEAIYTNADDVEIIDTFVSIENLTGTALDDVLTGDASDNRIEGGQGNDDLLGGDGADTLVGGISGLDTLTGEAGADTFVLGTETTVLNSSEGTGDFATIADFTTGEDVIQLSGVLEDYEIVNLGSTNLIALGDGEGDFDLIASVTNSDGAIAELDPTTDFTFV